jgi:hypothetical protein
MQAACTRWQGSVIRHAQHRLAATTATEATHAGNPGAASRRLQTSWPRHTTKPPIALMFMTAAACMVAGTTMGITHDFALAPGHAHLNLLGWAGRRWR